MTKAGLSLLVMMAAGLAAQHPPTGGKADPALQPPVLQTSPGAQYADANRSFQGIPGIERASNGRLWAVWYAGDSREGPANYVTLATSADDGKTWSGPQLVIDPPGFVRAFDACLWTDPQGRLWLFWAQAAGHWDGRGGVWAVVARDSGSARPKWSSPRRIADGVLMNKPITLSNGKWLLPVAVWTKPTNLPFINERDKLGLTADQVQELTHNLGTSRGVGVASSSDSGKTFVVTGRADFADTDTPSEHMLIEKHNGNVWMLARTKNGIGSSTSGDGGHTWSSPVHSTIEQPPTRFFIRRLLSGSLLLVKNAPLNGRDRSHLTAYISKDDGETWKGGLLLDDRMNVSYPDGMQSPDGKIYVVYDRERFTAREILMAAFREEDVLAGKPVSTAASLRMLVNRAGDLNLPGVGWRSLINGEGLAGWHAPDDKPNTWYRASGVQRKQGPKNELLEGTRLPGPLLINGPDGRTTQLVTDERFGDLELYLEFLISAKSNSGVYVGGLYEVQILDSYGAAKPGVHDSGAIYERWIDGKGVGGSAPLVNASRAPGEWQSMHIWFRGPRFDTAGKKIEDARFLKVELNGVVVQRDVPAPGPTRASLEIPEAPRNPLMLQGDHGPIAFRNMYVRSLDK